MTPALEAAGHSVVTPDLPSEDVEAGFGEYAAAVTASLGAELDSPNVLVGHSLGAMTVRLVAGQVQAPRLVYLCPLLPSRPDAPERFCEGWGAERRHDELGRSWWPPETVARSLCPSLPTDVGEAMAGRLRRQAQTPYERPYPVDPLPDVPSTFVIGLEDELIAVAWSRWAARELVGVEPIELPCGHFPMYDHCSALVELLLEEAA